MHSSKSRYTNETNLEWSMIISDYRKWTCLTKTQMQVFYLMECLNLSKFGNPAINLRSIYITRIGKHGSTFIVVVVDHLINTRSLFQSPSPNQRENKGEITWGLSCICRGFKPRIALVMVHSICIWAVYPHRMGQTWRLHHLHSFKQLLLLLRHQTRTIQIWKQEMKKVVFQIP